MVEINFSKTWDTEEQARNGNRMYQNHESKLSEQDMRDLVAAILDIPDMKDIAALNLSDKILAARLTRLSDALQGKGTDKIFVNKGIHQREDCPHFTINVTPIGSGEGNFEIFVRPDRRISRRVTSFAWEPWAISFSNKGIIYHFPTDTDGRRTNIWVGHNTRVRSGSISGTPRVGNVIAI